jgi:hypothetical protein
MFMSLPQLEPCKPQLEEISNHFETFGHFEYSFRCTLRCMLHILGLTLCIETD